MPGLTTLRSTTDGFVTSMVSPPKTIIVSLIPTMFQNVFRSMVPKSFSQPVIRSWPPASNCSLILICKWLVSLPHSKFSMTYIKFMVPVMPVIFTCVLSVSFVSNPISSLQSPKVSAGCVSNSGRFNICGVAEQRLMVSPIPAVGPSSIIISISTSSKHPILLS